MSGQNTSSAVMAQRIEPKDSFDYFPTPLWATRALCEWLFENGAWIGDAVHEPACGEGHMVRALQEFFGITFATDIQDMGFGGQNDFLFGPVGPRDFDWIITNPPFRLASQFIQRALLESRKGCAFLVRTSFLESVGRYDGLFSVAPPSDILQFSERVPMFKGRVDAKGSSATSYCWIVWRHVKSNCPPHFHWIPPCRKRLERDGDYA